MVLGRECIKLKIVQQIHEYIPNSRVIPWFRDFYANLKKVLALVLAFACAFTMFAGAAFTDQADIKATDAVNMLSSLGVITGYTDGSYQPNKVVTRAEMAKMIFVVRNNKIDDSAYQSNYSKLTDISNHWAKGYIKFCESQGIIAGKGNNKFDPDSPVTGVEAAKMLLVVAGYDTDKAGLTGSAWRTNTLKYAGAAGILDDVNAALEQGLPRQYAAQMIYNTLDTNRVKWSKDSESFDDVLNGGVKETVGHAYMGLTKTTGTLVSISKDALTVDNVIAADSDAVDYAGNYETQFTKVSEDYSDLLGQRVKVLFKDGKTNSVLGVYPTSDNTVYNTLLNGVEKDGKKIKFDGKSYSVATVSGTEMIHVYADGADKGKIALSKFDNDFSASTSLLSDGRVNRVSADEVTFVDSNDDGKIDTAIVTTVAAAKATYVSSSEIVAGNTTYKFEDENIASDIAKNDYVVITENLYDDCKDIVKATKLSGVKVTGTKTAPNRYLIDGEWYTEGANADMNSVKSGDTVDAYAVNGVVYYAKRTSGENSTLSDVAVVLAKGSDIQGDKVKLLKLDNTGKTEIVDIDNDPGTGYVQKAALKEGAAYEYSVKGGEYRFKELDKTKDYFGDYTALLQGTAAPASATAGLTVANKAGSTTKVIGGTEVDDSAKIILIDNYATSSADYKVITGKQFKSLSITNTVATDTKALDKGGIAAFTSKVDGVTRVTYGVVAVNGFANSFVTNDNYGYVTKDAYKVDDGYVVYSIWNGSEEVKVQEKGTTLRKKGAVLGYSSITKEDGLSDGVVGTIEDVDDNFGLVDNGVVYGVNSKQSKVSLNGKDTADITSDTIVLYVDTDDHKGYTEGEIQEADDFGTGKIPNVMYVLDTPSDFTSDVTLLVVDVKNNLHGSFNFVFGADATKTDLVNALAKADKITVDADAIRNAGSINVAADKTVVVTGTDLSNVFGNLKGAQGATLIIKEDSKAASYPAAYKHGDQSTYTNESIKAGTVFEAAANGHWVATK